MNVESPSFHSYKVVHQLMSFMCVLSEHCVELSFVVDEALSKLLSVIGGVG